MKEQLNLIELSGKLISEKSAKLNLEISKLNIKTTHSEEQIISKNILNIINELESRTSQLKTILNH